MCNLSSDFMFSSSKDYWIAINSGLQLKQDLSRHNLYCRGHIAEPIYTTPEDATLLISVRA